MEILGVPWAIIIAYGGFAEWSWIWTIGLGAVAGAILYFITRQTSVIGDIQRSGIPKTIAFIIVTQSITAAIIYGLGRLVGMLIN